uniref:Uncharacterized protein n=1 Tax=Molossus molossus TaxID=27622 RepID=A0A7J8ERN3_MOLMO|nr:hypothetical protein HJG59_008725 [Molossus molossus]
MLMNFIFFREIEEFADSASYIGPQATRHSRISETGSIFLPLVYSDRVENTEIGIHTTTPNRFVLCLSSPPWSLRGMSLTQRLVDTAMGLDALLHGGTLFVIPTIDSKRTTLPFFTQSISSTFCGQTLLMKGMSIIIYLDEFLEASS